MTNILCCLAQAFKNYYQMKHAGNHLELGLMCVELEEDNDMDRKQFNGLFMEK